MASPYQLYFSPGSSSLAVHWMLLEMQLEHELVRVNLDAGEHKQERYLKLNPNGMVPTLIVDGQATYETAGLLILLSERHPEKGLAPAPGTPERILFLQWMIYLANTVMPAYRGWFYPHAPAGEANSAVIKEDARKQIEAAWDRVDAHLATRPYLAGDRLSAVDFLGTMLMRWSRNMPKPATEWKAIGEYVKRMKALPSFRALYESEGLTEWA